MQVKGKDKCLMASKRNHPLIIGVAGALGSGKDTVFAIAQTHGFERRAFGDAVKREAATLIQRPDPLLEAAFPQDIQNILQRLRSGPRLWQRLTRKGVEPVYGPDAVWHKPTSPSVRRLLQWWGTELRRTRVSGYWVNHPSLKLDAPRIMVTDMRFANEVDFVRKRGGYVWQVQRERSAYQDYDPQLLTHASEDQGQFADVKWDAIIDNSGSLAELQEQVGWQLFQILTA